VVTACSESCVPPGANGPLDSLALHIYLRKILRKQSLIFDLEWISDSVAYELSCVFLVLRLSTSAESYLALRSHFAQSLSVASICGYVASNTLLDMRSGALVP
jgi:hypothetical protein